MSSRIGYAYNVPDLCRHSVGHRFSHTQTQGGAVIPVIRASGVLIQGEPPLRVYIRYSYTTCVQRDLESLATRCGGMYFIVQGRGDIRTVGMAHNTCIYSIARCP